jgi:hypothetical protein
MRICYDAAKVMPSCKPCLFSKLLESPAFAGEGKGSGCDRLIRAVEQPAKRGKDQEWQRHARSNFSAEPKFVGASA